jgi:hypothetical protein
MCRFVLIAAVAVVLVQAVSGRGAADIIQYESLDLAVARADLVVRGGVTEIVSKKGENDTVWNRVTVKVAETIKGEQLKEVTFLVREAPLEPRAASWRNLQDEMLFCLNTLKRPEGPFPVDYVLHGGFISWAVALNGAPKSGGPIYSLDFKPLTDAKELLNAARAAAGDQSVKAKSRLEWIVQGPDTLMPHAVLYPDSERVRAAARQRRVELLPW